MRRYVCPVCKKSGQPTEWIKESRREMDATVQYFRDELAIKEITCRAHPSVKKELERTVVLRGLL
jgi:hypothetical protein